MSKKANPTAIGAFVLGALVILVAAILMFGAGTLFTPVQKYTLFFGTSVKGLRVGAPVTFRGDKIGDVIDIRPLLNALTSNIDIQVIIEIPDADQVQIVGEGPLTELDDEEALAYLVNEKGLRAKLALQSMVTGQLFVDLDFYPDEPIRMRKIPTKHPQLPTIETGLQQLMKSFQDLPIAETMKKIQDALDAITTLATSPKLPETLDNVHGAAEETRKLAENLNTRVDQLSEDLLATSGAARSAMVQAKTTLALEEGRPGEIADALVDAEKTMSAAMKSLRDGSDAVGDAARGIEKVAEDVSGMLDDDAPIRTELDSLITELAAAARSIRILADYLERHPEAFIKGKQ